MAEEAKKYLDYDGLKHLVEKLTDRIEASGGGSGGGTAQGVYVAYVDTGGVNRICKPSDWSADMGTPSGAVIVAGGRNLLVGSGYLDELDSGCADQIPVTGVTACFEDELQARNDFRGRDNTQEREEKGGLEHAVSFCLSYSYGAVGAGRWWMPSLGELALVYDFLDGVVETFATIGTNFRREYSNIASNTIQRMGESAWGLNFDAGEAFTYRRDETSDYNSCVFPVSEWVWVEATGGVNDEPEPQPSWYLDEARLFGVLSNRSGREFDGTIAFSLVFSDSLTRGDGSEVTYDTCAWSAYIGPGGDLEANESKTIREQVDRRWFLGIVLTTSPGMVINIAMSVKSVWDGFDTMENVEIEGGERFFKAGVDMAQYDGKSVDFDIEADVMILEQ